MHQGSSYNFITVSNSICWVPPKRNIPSPKTESNVMRILFGFICCGFQETLGSEFRRFAIPLRIIQKGPRVRGEFSTADCEYLSITYHPFTMKVVPFGKKYPLYSSSSFSVWGMPSSVRMSAHFNLSGRLSYPKAQQGAIGGARRI